MISRLLSPSVRRFFGVKPPATTAPAASRPTSRHPARPTHYKLLDRPGPPAPLLAALNRVDFHPYSDYLLHDMDSLGDGVEQGTATGREMRTQPLWGLRPATSFLHDGASLTIEDAIRRHDGQGRDGGADRGAGRNAKAANGGANAAADGQQHCDGGQDGRDPQQLSAMHYRFGMVQK